MAGVDNPDLGVIAGRGRLRLRRVVAAYRGNEEQQPSRTRRQLRRAGIQ